MLRLLGREKTSGVLWDCHCGPWRTSRGLLCALIGTFCSRYRLLKTGFEARPRRPAFDRHIDIGRIGVEPAEAPPGPLLAMLALPLKDRRLGFLVRIEAK